MKDYLVILAEVFFPNFIRFLLQVVDPQQLNTLFADLHSALGGGEGIFIFSAND